MAKMTENPADFVRNDEGEHPRNLADFSVRGRGWGWENGTKMLNFGYFTQEKTAEFYEKRSESPFTIRRGCYIMRI